MQLHTLLASGVALLLGVGPAAGQALQELLGHEAPVYAVAFRPDGRLLATGSFDSRVRIWDAGGKQVLRMLAGHRTKVVALAWSPDGRQLVSADAGGGVRLWDLDRRKYRLLRGPRACVYAVTISPDGRHVIACGQDECVKVWSTTTGKLEQDWHDAGCPQYAVAIAADGRTVAHGGLDGTIHLADLESGIPLGILTGHTDAVYSLAFAPDGQLLSGSGDRTIRRWDWRRGEQTACFQGHREAVYQVSCTPDCGRLVSAGTDGFAVIWDADRAAALESRRLPGRALCAAFAPDGARIAVGTGQARCYVMEVPPHVR